ncbi:ATG5, partial [Symbiodinium sp. KB8]
VMAPRCLPLSLTYINSKVQEVFSQVAPSTPAGTASNLWFSAAGVPLRDPSLPFGVLADALLPAGHTGPIPVQVHLSRRASDVLPAGADAESNRFTFMNSLKQAIFLRCGSDRAYIDSPTAKLDTLWSAMQEQEWRGCHWRNLMSDTVEGVARVLQRAGQEPGQAAVPPPPVPDAQPAEDADGQPAQATEAQPAAATDAEASETAVHSVPLRLLCRGESSFVQGQMLWPVQSEQDLKPLHARGIVGASRSLGDAVRALADAADCARIRSALGQEGVCFVVQGIAVPAQADPVELYHTLAHPDAFLYVTVAAPGE